MKKILLSLGTLAVVGVVIAGATGAFYNDTETSTGNIFVAGSVDLKVDHLKQTYNGVDCKTCSVTAVSDVSNMVVAGSAGEGDPVTFPHPAKLVTFIHPAWTADVDGSVNDAEWIWATDPVVSADITNDVIYTFEKTFNWMGPISGATLSFAVSADNSYEVYLNGHLLRADTAENNFASPDSIPSTDITPWIVQGTNTLEFKVKNWAQPGGNPQTNPAGLLYKLTINGNCAADSDFAKQCSLWQEKDLGPNDTFFKFGDVKPGDFGTDVISLHVYDNDAYACLIIDHKDDQENSLLGPEITAGDLPSVGNPIGKGELSNDLNVFTWKDTNGNGVYDSGESSLGSGPLSSLSSIMSMDPTTQSHLTATTTQDIGLAWCAGTLTPNQGGNFSCNGSGMSNKAQSDSFSADLTAYAEQVRNNGQFTCAGVQLPPRP